RAAPLNSKLSSYPRPLVPHQPPASSPGPGAISTRWEARSTQNHFHLMLPAGKGGHKVTLNFPAIHRDLGHTPAHPVGIAHGDMVNCAPRLPAHLVAFPLRGDAGVDAQSIVVRFDAQDSLGDGRVVPGSRAREPGVFGLAVVGG